MFLSFVLCCFSESWQVFWVFMQKKNLVLCLKSFVRGFCELLIFPVKNISGAKIIRCVNKILCVKKYGVRKKVWCTKKYGVQKLFMVCEKVWGAETIYGVRKKLWCAKKKFGLQSYGVRTLLWCAKKKFGVQSYGVRKSYGVGFILECSAHATAFLEKVFIFPKKVTGGPDLK